MMVKKVSDVAALRLAEDLSLCVASCARKRGEGRK